LKISFCFRSRAKLPLLSQALLAAYHCATHQKIDLALLSGGRIKALAAGYDKYQRPAK
jgi:hypothetical protein